MEDSIGIACYLHDVICYHHRIAIHFCELIKHFKRIEVLGSSLLDAVFKLQTSDFQTNGEI